MFQLQGPTSWHSFPTSVTEDRWCTFDGVDLRYTSTVDQPRFIQEPVSSMKVSHGMETGDRPFMLSDLGMPYGAYRKNCCAPTQTAYAESPVQSTNYH